MSVLQFKKKVEDERYLEGKAICVSCKHKWVAVAPVGTKELECPECHTMKGLFINPVGVPEGTEYWQCNCGCEIFFVLKEFIQCYECGSVQSF